MGRYARNSSEGIPYHVINRGNNHQPIFFREDDYLFFHQALGREFELGRPGGKARENRMDVM